MNYDLDPDTRRALQELARHQMIEELLADMRFDMEVCELEGWDPREFPTMVRKAVKEEWCFPQVESTTMARG